MYLKTQIYTVFQFQQVDENDILNIMYNLTPNTSSDIDNLITNQVLGTGIFQEKLKIAKVITIF